MTVATAKLCRGGEAELLAALLPAGEGERMEAIQTRRPRLRR